jgi:4-amino-4-deoxy-L-arabinose transferase-like glycosyltransferase
MSDFRVSRLSKILEVALLPISIVFIILFFYVALSRASYPFELNWLEGGVLNVVERVMAGQSIYTEPTLEYVPFSKTPLYFLLTSLIANMVGPGFMALRSVSIASTFFCLLLIYMFVKHDTRSGFLGIISAGLFAAFYNVSGGWMDIGRIDAFNLFILLSALFIIRFYRNNKSYLAAGILLFLAFFANQYSVILIIFILAYGVIYNRRSILPVLLSAVVLIIASTFIMDKFYDNWYSYYIIDLPLNFNITISNISLFWTEELFRTCMIPIGFIVFNVYSNS